MQYVISYKIDEYIFEEIIIRVIKIYNLIKIW